MPEYEGLIKYPVASDMYNSSYGEPQWWRDFAVTTAAEIAKQAAEVNFVKPFSGTGGDFNDLTDPGLHSYWADWANRPSDASGSVLVFPPPNGRGGARGQVAFPYGTNSGIWYRFSGASGTTWSAWTRMDAGGITPAEGGDTGGGASALKRVPLILTASSGSATDSAAAGAIRFPLHYGARVTRWRVHVRNYSYSSGTAYASGGNISGMWFGPGFDGEFTSTPTQVAWPMTIPTNGEEVVTPWINTEIPADTKHMLSIGWTASTATPKFRAPGGGWVSTSSGSAPSASGAGFNVSGWFPYDWWIEAETDATTPTIAGYGDSITAGTGTELTVYTSWLSQYARKIGALPVHYAYPGSGMVLWMNGTDAKWSRWSDFPKADGVIHAMGQNDLGTATTASIMQDRFDTTLPFVREFISDNVYVSTITPHAGKTSAQNDVRREHAAYLKTLPLGVRDVFDFAAAVSSDDIGLKPEYKGGNGTDELHPNAAGAAEMSDAVVRPVTAGNPATAYLNARGA